jgi:hypothetical protein
MANESVVSGGASGGSTELDFYLAWLKSKYPQYYTAITTYISKNGKPSSLANLPFYTEFAPPSQLPDNVFLDNYADFANWARANKIDPNKSLYGLKQNSPDYIAWMTSKSTPTTGTTTTGSVSVLDPTKKLTVIPPVVTTPIVDRQKSLDVWAGYSVDNIGRHYYDDKATGQRYYFILGADGKPLNTEVVPLLNNDSNGGGLSTAEQLAWERQKLADSLGSTERQNELDRQLRQQELNIQQGANIASAELERKKWLAQLGASPQDFIEYSKQAYGKLPETPTWLAKFSPALQAGQTIQPLALGSPSAQWYNRAAPTQKGMLQGYTNWSAAQGQGGVWEDQLATMKNMLPTEQPYPINNWRPTWTGR